ncbi:hypothetical protein EV14_2405 [Prochlorococcus sp. MIT 0703]|nr:hypothetical protein EV12_1174 [Prochlorococcus sp. MIT 0701]KGG31285.1 hypothetical protein EV14_2405 [Prochlorococcus sp. MIT 0703]
MGAKVSVCRLLSQLVWQLLLKEGSLRQGVWLAVKGSSNGRQDL